MSRTTQYIGLNKFGQELVKDAIRVETYNMTTGMFNEIVEGSIYHMKPPEGPNISLIYKEVVQTIPWSGGPMIFTALKRTLIKECGQEIVDQDLYCAWIIDPSLYAQKQEFNFETARMFV